MNKERLLNVAKALRESPNPEKFTMLKYGHFCGTPACAIGHYAARGDLQDAFILSRYSGLCTPDGLTTSFWSDAVAEHFGIDEDQASALFHAEHGCGNAETAIEAAEFIEKFVAEAE